MPTVARVLVIVVLVAIVIMKIVVLVAIVVVVVAVIAVVVAKVIIIIESDEMFQLQTWIRMLLKFIVLSATRRKRK